MKKLFAAGLIAFCIPSIALAGDQPNVTSTVSNSLEESVRSDTAAAIAALEKGDYRDAAHYLQTAGDNANRLSLQSVAQEIQLATQTFQSQDTAFALASSSTIEFEEFLKDSDTLERRFKDADGNVVTVRIFGEDSDLADFKTLAADTKMLKKNNIETAEMMGDTALKRKGEDDSLSVI